MSEEKISPQLQFCSFLSGEEEKYKSKDGQMFRWTSTHWQVVQTIGLERMAFKFLAEKIPDKCSEKMAASCAASAILNAEHLDDPLPNLIPVQNGCIYLTTGELRSHSPNFGLTYCLSCHFDPSSTAPGFDAFLAESLPDAEIRAFLCEYSGYTLLPDTRHQLACWLVGPGGNGKSTFAEIMQALHGRPVSLSLDALDGFNLSSLPGASLVYCDETPPRIDEQRLKTLVSGSAVQIDRKYMSAICFKPTAKWLISGNTLPAITDHSDGFWRRWIVIPFTTKPATIKPQMADQVIVTELSGVLNWALSGLARLLERGRFPDLPEGLKTAQNEGKKQSNSVAGWIEDVEPHLAEGKDGGMPKLFVYSNYHTWANENGVRPVSSMKFWERIKQHFPDLVEFRRAGEESRRCVNLLYVSQNMPSMRQ